MIFKSLKQEKYSQVIMLEYKKENANKIKKYWKLLFKENKAIFTHFQEN